MQGGGSRQRSSLTSGHAAHYLLALLFVCAHWSALAASQFGLGSGLQSLQVQTIAVDAQGYVWAGTQDGLVYFDGHRFEPFELSPPGAVPDEHVVRLLHRPGELFAATTTRLHRIDLKHWRSAEILAEGRSLANVQSMRVDTAGGLWIGNQAGELWHAGDTGQPLKRVVLQGIDPLPGITDIAITDHELWLATTEGVFRGSRATRAISPFVPTLAGFSPSDPYVSAIHVDRLGTLWIGYWNDALLRHDPTQQTWRWFHPQRPGAGALRSTSIYGFHESADRLYVATNRGLVVFHPDCDCLRALNHPDWDRVDGNGVVVTGLAPDGDGLWAGVWGRGLVRFTRNDEAFERLVPVDDRADSLAHPMVYSVLADREQRLWIGTYGAGVQWANREHRPWHLDWRLNRAGHSGLRTESRFTWTMLEQRDRLLIGTGFGLWAWQNGELSALNGELQSIRSLFQLDPDTLLIGTSSGLFRRSGETLSPIALPADLRSRTIWSIGRWRDEIWLGTGQGLLRLGPQFEVRALHRVGKGKDDMPGPVVWAQRLAPNGQTWLATSGGLLEVEDRDGAPGFVLHDRAADIGIKNIVSIEFGARGELWLGTPRGLLRYQPDRRELAWFDSHDGLISDQLNPGASTGDDERLYFAGAGGVVAFDPDVVTATIPLLRPSVVRSKIGNGAWQAPTQDIDLPNAPPALQLQLSAFYFARPERVRYSYRWQPGDREFTELGDAHHAVFAELPSGRRQLILRATLPGTPAVSAEREVLTVIVAKAWFETWLGRALVGTGVFLSLLGLYGWRMRSARLRALALGREVDLRTEELSRAKSALEAANDKLRQRVQTDALTGLSNRHHALELAQVMHDRGNALAVMLLDLDYFKQINDEHGHLVGDAVLVNFATVLREVLNGSFLCARYGGEEFLAISENCPPERLADLAQRLLLTVRQQVVTNDHGGALAYTVSIGTAVSRRDESINALIRRADMAMYLAKAAGRNQVMRG